MTEKEIDLSLKNLGSTMTEEKRRLLEDIYVVSRRIYWKLIIKRKFEEARKYARICKQIEEWLDEDKEGGKQA